MYISEILHLPEHEAEVDKLDNFRNTVRHAGTLPLGAMARIKPDTSYWAYRHYNGSCYVLARTTALILKPDIYVGGMVGVRVDPDRWFAFGINFDYTTQGD